MVPLGNRVFLRRLSAEKAKSPFIDPDTAKEKGTLCEVVSIPTQPYQSEWGAVLYCPVVVGDQCIIGKYTIDTKINGEDLVVVRWEELLAHEPREVESMAPAPPAPPFDIQTVQERTIGITDRHLGEAESTADLSDKQRAEDLTARFLNKLAAQGGQV